MSIFAEALQAARSPGKKSGSGAELYALACAKAAQRLGRKARREVSAREVAKPEHFEDIAFELKILQSLALCGWMLDDKNKMCTKSFISEEARTLADQVLTLAAGGKPAHTLVDDEELIIDIPQAELDAILAREAA